MTDRRENTSPPPDWRVDPRPFCPTCMVPLRSCGCPVAERILAEHRATYESHIHRGEN